MRALDSNPSDDHANETTARIRAAAERARGNIVIGGPMNGGKTTLMMAWCDAIGPDERLVTVEAHRQVDSGRRAPRKPNVPSPDLSPCHAGGRFDA